MLIEKIINNNIVSAVDSKGREVVVMGRGLGFGMKPGRQIQENKIEKVFRIKSQTLAEQFKDLLADMPLEHVKVSSDIITYAKENLKLKLNQSIYVTLTDHINFAITRYQQGIKPQNALLWEIKRFYSREYELGMYAVKTIEEKLRIRLPEDEAGFIALHFLNAEYGTDIRDAVKFPNLVKKILEIVEEKLQIELDETSLHYERFVTHIKFLLQRVYRKELLPDEESELAELMQKKYQKEYDCSKMVAAYIEEETIRTLSETSTLAFDKIANPFIGIIAGLIGSMCYNRFKNTQLPDWLSFFSGKRCVAIVSGVVSIIASVVLLFVWPVIFGALVALGEAIVSLDAVGAGIYAFFNRLLIPFGLHHALNNVFWFDTIGLGDLTHFWAGETSADVTWSLGMYMSGFFPCMMFGIPGAALAMVHTAKPAKKKVAIGLVASAAIAAFVCGVTEPFEFGFMFLAPVLYVIYALLYGIFVTITTLVGFRAGFSFSAGATDLLFSASLPAAQKTWMIIPLGIAAFIVFYVVFRFAIVKFNLKTPGREDDDVDETTVKLANNNFTEVAKIILEGVGGKENVASIDNCITRLRLEIKDYTKVDEKKIKSAGVAGVIRPGKTSVQVIIGTKVQFVADEFKKLCK